MRIQYKHTILIGAFIFISFFVPQSQAYILDLKDASPYNALIFGDMEASRSDTEGRLAVGGNITLDNYAVGLKLDSANNPYDTLIAGGELNFIDGHVYNGDARSGLSANLTRVGFTGGEYISGNTLDFATLEQQAKNNSATWSNLTSNASASLSNGQLYLYGDSATLNIFSISATDLDPLFTNEFILEIPDNSWALINVAGADISLSNLGFYRITSNGNTQNTGDLFDHDGSLTQTVLFNLFEAETLKVNNVGVAGSILAPFATTTFYDAHIDGQLIASSLKGKAGETSGQLNNYPFIPDTPLPSATNQTIPTPSLFMLLSVAGLLFLRFKIIAQK